MRRGTPIRRRRCARRGRRGKATRSPAGQRGYGVAARTREGCPDAQFRLRAVVKYYDTAYREYGSEEYTADFSPCTEEWQFASVRFAKEMIISLLWHLKSVLYNIPAGLAEIKKLFPKNY